MAIIKRVSEREWPWVGLKLPSAGQVWVAHGKETVAGWVGPGPFHGGSRWNRTASQSHEAGGARRTGHTGRDTRDRAGHAMELEGRGDGVKKVGQAVASVSRGKHGLPVASQPSSVPPRPSVGPPPSRCFLETSIKEEIKRFCRRLVHR